VPGSHRAGPETVVVMVSWWPLSTSGLTPRSGRAQTTAEKVPLTEFRARAGQPPAPADAAIHRGRAHVALPSFSAVVLCSSSATL
jgi:hypothetical protein